jgi:hypothetical protein
MYPDGSSVRVTVKETSGGYYVTDAGRALVQVRISGHQTDKPGYYLARAANVFRVKYSRGMLSLSDVGAESLDTAIALVANASLHGVSLTMANYSVPSERNFKFAFDGFIRETFGDNFRRDIINGAHNVHHLDYVHRNNEVVITDPLKPDRMSVDRAFSVHSDILRAVQAPALQLLVFDGNDNWRQSDLDHIKSVGVPVIEYCEAVETLKLKVPLRAA